MPTVPPAQIQFVSLDVIRLPRAERPILRRCQLELQLTDNAPRDLVLNLEDVFELAIVALRPDLIPIARVDQLDADTNALIHAPNTALENRPDVQDLSDLGDAERFSLESETRCAGCNVESGNS